MCEVGTRAILVHGNLADQGPSTRQNRYDQTVPFTLSRASV